MTTFREAADSIMPVGKHRGLTLDQIGESDRGLLYLDWLRGELDPKPRQTILDRALLKDLVAYLDDAAIAVQLRELVERRR